MPKLTVTPRGLNLRSGPGATYPSLVVMPQGTRLDLSAHDVPKGQWLPVHFESDAGLRVGWAHTAYLLPDWLALALEEEGVTEVPGGAASNPRILEYHAATELHAREDGTSWCSSFVNWVFERLKMLRTRSAHARDWLLYGLRLKVPLYGCLVIFRRPGGGEDPQDVTRGNGHVAFFIREDLERPGRVVVFGGNQGDRVCFESKPEADVLGYRWPPLGKA
jgi:uncharacterized protein (TIGR02594 family)